MKYAMLLLALAVPSFAAPYARPIDFSHVQQSAALDIDPNGVAPSVIMTDFALLTHSNADGSIIPKAWQSWCPPENWAILEIGFGGSAHVSGLKLAGNAIVHVGSSLNVAPQLGALILAKVDATSPTALQAVKAAMLGINGGGVRIGYGLDGDFMYDGKLQSMKEAFPGQGALDILKKASRVTVGYAWTW